MHPQLVLFSMPQGAARRSGMDEPQNLSRSVDHMESTAYRHRTNSPEMQEAVELDPLVSSAVRKLPPLELAPHNALLDSTSTGSHPSAAPQSSTSNPNSTLEESRWT
ncbi:hypothetical protein CYMTET_39499 [Cymbomonas tetramitiformis]|uniref:Uncharacterized protein n=1 Tax=Cymbomonas tetramitiformis TaxID=36881 RepID=A0AAE0C9Y8_9CHLO|nr:hypothetical protein CYMTET_39499 [Cymbomonas tetramitiformis]